MTRTKEPIAILTDHDHGKVMALLRGQHFAKTRVADEESGDGIGIEDHLHSLGSIRSNSSLTIASTGSTSSRRA